jgi:Skp family chaperone for outer membrane proteins
MMNRSLIVLGLVLGMLFPAVSEAKVKIGVVNLQRAVGETAEGKKAEQDLTRLKKKLEAELNRKLKEFYAKEKKLQEASSILKDSERRKRLESSRKEMEQLQKDYVGAERQLMERKTKAMMKITRKLNGIIEKIAKRDRYDYVFANAAVLWAPRHVDITNEVIRLYNAAKR